MRKLNTITKAYTRHYRDNGQIVAYVEWSDGSRTEGGVPVGDPTLGYRCNCGHMEALFATAQRNGLTIGREVW